MSEIPAAVVQQPEKAADQHPPEQSVKKKSEFLEKLQERYDQSPQIEPLAKAKEMLDLEKEEVRTLSAEDYVDYLSLLEDLGDEELILKNFEVIAERFEKDIVEKSSSPEVKDYYLAREIGRLTNSTIFQIRQDYPDPTVVDKLYSLVNSENRLVSHYTLEMVNELVWRDSSGKLFDRYMEDVTDHLVDTEPEADGGLVTRGLLDNAWGSFGDKCMFEILEKSITKAGSNEALERTVKEFTDRKGLEKTTIWLREIAKKPDLKDKVDTIVGRTFGHGGVIHDDLRDLYESIQFESYKINQEVTEGEANLLVAKVPKGSRVLDVGTGTGRLMEALKDKGREVVGFDFTERHARLIKEKDPKAKVMVADWQRTPIRDSSLDAAYCLGRSFTHNITYEEQVSFFQEMKRVLKTDGVLVVDIPNPEKGYYKENREKLAKKLQEQGINYYEEGLIFDSPDSENFFTRLSPLPQQFEAIARLGGFVVDDLVTRELPTGKGDENLYYVLRKSNEPPKDIIGLMGQARTSGPVLRAEWL